MFNPIPTESNTKTAEQISAELTEWVIITLARRHRLLSATKHIRCPECLATQIQLVISYKLAKWKCRECSHAWIQEPITLISK